MDALERRHVVMEPSERPRFEVGQRILTVRSGHSAGFADSVAEVLQVLTTDEGEIYRVRWHEGLETFFVPSADARERRSGDERRSGIDRRTIEHGWLADVDVDRRRGDDRRSGRDRRSP